MNDNCWHLGGICRGSPIHGGLRVFSKPSRLTERLQQQPNTENADLHPASTSAEQVRMEASRISSTRNAIYFNTVASIFVAKTIALKLETA
jgi:hypothetical protein